jgi:AraC-like DNA-binding protein
MLTDAMFESPDQIADHGFHAPIEPFETDGAIFEERRWREPEQVSRGSAAGADIVMSRWTASPGGGRIECTVTPDGCHIIALALNTTWISVSTPSKTLFEGSLPPGTLIVNAPSQRLRARATPSFDFLQFRVPNHVLREEGMISDEDDFVRCSELPPFRDTLAEALGRSLLGEDAHRSRPEYAQVVARTIVMRAMGRRQAKRRCWALPKWRMRRLEQYLEASIDKRVSLDDMASAAGLSKMHFAAQFRAATGFRPHEYLLFKRIERAKMVISTSRTPLVEVAFSVGFNAQAHFSTVFKRFTGKTPAQWRQENFRAPASQALGRAPVSALRLQANNHHALQL